MAFHILINKLVENSATCQYQFTCGADRRGVFQIEKETGDVLLLEAMVGDEPGHVFQRAAVKILKEWRKGTLPDAAEWAS